MTERSHWAYISARSTDESQLDAMTFSRQKGLSFLGDSANLPQETWRRVDLNEQSNILKDFYKARTEKTTNETQVVQLCNALLEKLFGSDGFDAFKHAVAAEGTVKRFGNGMIKRGRADVLGDNLIIEYKYDLSNPQQLATAKRQLEEDLRHQRESGDKSQYLLISSDGLKWLTYASREDEQYGTNLVVSDEVQFNGRNIEEFVFYLKGIAFRRERVTATKERVRVDLGLNSPVFIAATEGLRKAFAKCRSSMIVLNTKYSLWKQQISIAYGSDQDDVELFLRHTYLTLVSYIFAALTVESTTSVRKALRDILSGEWFRRHYVRNLVETDYFTWVLDVFTEAETSKALNIITDVLETYDTEHIPEDFLRELYQQLVDPITRHDLGEFYTPEWLADLVIERSIETCPVAKDSLPRILDPSCGSGTFLRSAATHLLNLPHAHESSIPALIDSVVGIDIHPLAVITAKTNLFLVWRQKIREYAKPLSLPVFLANTLTHTVGTDEHSPLMRILEGDSKRWKVQLNDQIFSFSEYLLARQGFFDSIIENIEDICNGHCADSNSSSNAVKEEVVEYMAKQKEVEKRDAEELIRYSLFLYEQKSNKNDSVYSFVLRNQSMPKVLEGQFDIVVGNPPWLTLKDISNQQYKDEILALNDEYIAMSRAVGEQSHTEIASLFIPLALRYFLKGDAQKRDESKNHIYEYQRVAFVLPRSFMTAKQHARLRDSKSHPHYFCTEIWDLDQVDNLFRVPSCVLFFTPHSPLKDKGEFIESPKSYQQILGRKYKGNGGNNDASISSSDVSFEDCKFTHLCVGDKISAYVDPPSALNEYIQHIANHRKILAEDFTQGAILYPQPLLIVEPVDGIRHPTMRVVTDYGAQSKTKIHSLATYKLDLLVNTDSICFTAAGEHIYPYALRENTLWNVVLPVCSLDIGKVILKSPGELRAGGARETAKYWSRVEDEWSRLKKEGDPHLWERIDFNSNLTCQDLSKRYALLANASGKRQYVSLLDTLELPLPFVARDKTYQLRLDDIGEAGYYLGVLNSDYLDEIIGPFLNLGLLGKRDIGTRMLSLPIPTYDSECELHQEISHQSIGAWKASRDLLKQSTYPRTASMRDVGLMRNMVRNELQAQIKEIDNLVRLLLCTI